jgi:hypothetical protein
VFITKFITSLLRLLVEAESDMSAALCAGESWPIRTKRQGAG